MVKHDDTVISISPNGSGPAPYRFAKRYRWECSEEEGSEGFCIEARANITNAERDALEAGRDAVLAYNTAWNETPEDERSQHDTPRRRELELITPFIRAWNAVGTDAVTDEDTPIPSPAEGGVAVFDLIERPMADWMLRAVLNGYLSGKGLNAFGVALRALREATPDGKPADPS